MNFKHLYKYTSYKRYIFGLKIVCIKEIFYCRKDFFTIHILCTHLIPVYAAVIYSEKERADNLQ